MNTIVPLVKPFKSKLCLQSGISRRAHRQGPKRTSSGLQRSGTRQNGKFRGFLLNPRGTGGESGTPIIRRPLHASGDYGDRWGVQAAPVSLPAHRQFQKNSCSPKRSLLPSGISEESNRRSSTRRNGKVARTPSQMVQGLTPIRRRSGSPCTFLSTLGRAASTLPFSKSPYLSVSIETIIS